ncbi:hypothetical protein PINS_up015698 [Pythium insidiosum]|nr:hypothetical protein PINS_up015698 [Pythium insidiosum]
MLLVATAPRAGLQLYLNLFSTRARAGAQVAPAQSNALPHWSKIKTDLDVTEINTPANGSYYLFAIGAAKINVCPDQFTYRDRKMRREGGFYRREIKLAILARLLDLLTIATSDRAQLCRRFLPPGRPPAELFDRMERHFRAAAAVSCVDICPMEYWAHEEELLGTAHWFGEPLFVFEVCPDDRVLLQVFRGDNDKSGARGQILARRPWRTYSQAAATNLSDSPVIGVLSWRHD